MADTGVLEHDEIRRGGVLRLSQEDGENRLVLLGPRGGNAERGVVEVYGAGRLLAKLDVTDAEDGRLSLRVGSDDGPHETVLLEAGSDDGRRAKLVLTEQDSRDPNERGRIELGFDDDGPFLALTKGLNTVKLSVGRGLEVPRFFAEEGHD
jgi:hypothetical protein